MWRQLGDDQSAVYIMQRRVVCSVTEIESMSLMNTTMTSSERAIVSREMVQQKSLTAETGDVQIIRMSSRNSPYCADFCEN